MINFLWVSENHLEETILHDTTHDNFSQSSLNTLILFAAASEHSPDGPEVVHPPPDGLAGSGQGDVAAGEAAAVEAAAAAALTLCRARSNHS